MYLKTVIVRNVKSLEAAELSWSPGREPGWHVILGDNGQGKSTLLRAISLALLGPSAPDFLRLAIAGWAKQGAPGASVELELTFDETFDPLRRQGGSRAIPKILYTISGTSGLDWPHRSSYATSHERALWSQTSRGWFSTGFGPFRRFTGGAESMTKFFYSHPRFGRHLSLHGEDVAFTEIVTWMKDLHYRSVSNPNSDDGDLFLKVCELVNAPGLLPDHMKLEAVGPDGVFFSAPTIDRIPVESLSDGYRSILSLVLEVVRQAVVSADHPASHFEGGALNVPGVVLIDEIEVHLHPIWQASVGDSLKRVFPRVQFLVTTHSPLVCHAANTVWKLVPTDTGVVGRSTTPEEYDILRYGTVQQAYGLTDAFGVVPEQSTEGAKRAAARAQAAYRPEVVAALLAERDPRR